MSELLALGVSHKTAPVAMRERVALPDALAEDFMSRLLAGGDVAEVVVISTCNRTEVYAVAPDPVAAETAVLGQLARRAEIRPTELAEPIYSLRNCDAARHLYRVTAGLEAMIVGESEIQGQVRLAYDRALRAGATGQLTNRLFAAALATGKRVRSQTAISASRTSVPSVAVQAATEAIGELTGRRVVILGTGDMAEGTAQALSHGGVATVFVANRRRERAAVLAQRFDGEVVSFDALPAELERADIVLASTSSPHPIVGHDELAEVMRQRAGRPLLAIDIAVPRDVDPLCAQIPGVTLYDIDDLQSVVSRNRQVRAVEAQRAEAIIEEEIQRFAGWLGSMEVLPTVAALRARGTEIVDGVLAENEGRWEALTPRDRERVEAIARAVAKRLLHEPTLHMKRGADERTHARLELLRELFGLDEPSSPAAPAAEPPAPVSDLSSRRAKQPGR